MLSSFSLLFARVLDSGFIPSALLELTAFFELTSAQGGNFLALYHK